MKKKQINNRVTLADVAEQAGVSSITVSRVVNGYEGVTAALREKVERIVNELGYIPNRSASILASSRSKIIGVIVPSLSNVVFNEVLRGIYDVAGPTGYQVLLAITHYSAEEEERSIRTLLSQSPEGLIVTGGDQTESAKNMLRAANIPVVQIMERLENPLDMNVGFSHQEAGASVVEGLWSRGYRKVGFIGARMDTRVCQRLAGFKQALVERNGLDESLIVTTPKPSSVALGASLLHELMSRSKGQCDAVFCCNDDLALGVLFESQRMNIQTPVEFGICGFNDIDMAAHVQPSLSSVHVPRHTMGAKALELIFARLQGEDAPSYFDTGFNLVARDSLRK